MEIKKDLNQLAGKVTGAAVEVQHGMQAVWLARGIKRELDAGATIEGVLSGRLPTLDPELVRGDAAQLTQGIQSLQESTRQTLNMEQVRQRLADALCDLNAGQRVLYLHNTIEAIATAYPDCAPDSETMASLQTIADAEQHTDADVSALLDVLAPLLPQLGELLQRSTVKAMLQRMDKIDHAQVAQKISTSENAVAAYAAACYIMQKRGKQVGADGQSDRNIPAFSIGAAAAASVESSKVVELYQAGKLTLEAAVEKVCNFFTAVVSYACESVIHAMALSLYTVTSAGIACWLTDLFLFLGAFLYFSPITLCVAATLLAVGITSLTISVKDCEDLICLAWDLLQSVWDKIASLWHKTAAQTEAEDAAEVQEETETADESEVEDEDEDEEEEDEDNEEDENQEEGVDVFA